MRLSMIRSRSYLPGKLSGKIYWGCFEMFFLHRRLDRWDCIFVGLKESQLCFDCGFGFY